MLNHRAAILRNRMLRQEIDDRSVSHSLVQLVDVIPRGVRAKPLQNLHVSTSAGLVHSAHAKLVRNPRFIVISCIGLSAPG